MRSLPHRVLLIALALTACSAVAQMHKVAKPEQVVRAVGVYEWTGDFNKPNASRLIPVSLYIDGQFQDAGIYIARPVPFALLSGNVYELESAGTDKGLLDLVYARHLEAINATGDLAYDDGWFGYGKVEPLAVPRRRTTALKPSRHLPVLQSSVKDTAADADPDRPTMIRRNGTNTSSSGSSSGTTTSASGSTSTSTSASGSGTPADDPDRPVMKRRDGTDTSTTPATTTTTASTSTPADDPDRPTMQRRDSPGTSTTTASTTDPANDPDRPTLKRRTPAEAAKARNANDGASTLGYESLNDDPNRPRLHYGKPTHALSETDLPKLTGLPQNLHQMVAVSDAVNRDPHSFVLAWDDASQRAAILEKMQTLARAQLAAYDKPATTVAPAPKATVKKPSTTRTHHAAKVTPKPPIALADEDLKAYMLSYGGDPTYIYSAHTEGTGASLRYVTIVAQSDSLGQFKPAIQNVTDAAHLDDKPRMHFIDAVDAEASNRASLLFELRGQTARQFALYRVIAAHSDQIFLTGTTQ
jgi:hypothetical protein